MSQFNPRLHAVSSEYEQSNLKSIDNNFLKSIQW